MTPLGEREKGPLGTLGSSRLVYEDRSWNLELVFLSLVFVDRDVSSRPVPEVALGDSTLTKHRRR